jgi:hypothetical protein
MMPSSLQQVQCSGCTVETAIQEGSSVLDGKKHQYLHARKAVTTVLSLQLTVYVQTHEV